MSSPSICDDPSLTDDNIGNVLLIPAAILTVPSVITTGLRLLARRKSLGKDDWTILIAACLVVAMNALSIVGVHHGKGRHVCFLEDDAVAIIGKYSWTNQIVLFWALAFIKASVCLLILRVKSTAILRWISGVTIGLMFVSTVVACAALMSECKPIYAYWDRSSGQCRPPTFRIYSIWVQASVSVLTDLTCSLMPFPILWSLQIAPRKKIGVGLLMVMGAIAFVFAILRAASLSLKTRDTTYDYTLTATWMTLEANIGLVASNVGPMYALLRWWKSPARAAGYDYSSRDLDHNFNSHRASNVRAASRRGANRVSDDDDDDSEHSLCDRGYLGVTGDAKKITSPSASVNSGIDDTEGIPLEVHEFLFGRILQRTAFVMTAEEFREGYGEIL